MTTLALVPPFTELYLPPLIAGEGDRAALRLLEFFTVNIRHKNTRVFSASLAPRRHISTRSSSRRFRAPQTNTSQARTLNQTEQGQRVSPYGHRLLSPR